MYVIVVWSKRASICFQNPIKKESFLLYTLSPGYFFARNVLSWIFNWCGILIQTFGTVKEILNFATK